MFHIATDKILAEKQEEIENLTKHKNGMLLFYHIGMTKHIVYYIKYSAYTSL